MFVRSFLKTLDLGYWCHTFRLTFKKSTWRLLIACQSLAFPTQQDFNLHPGTDVSHYAVYPLFNFLDEL